jgi:hypothetical protein
MTTDSPRRSAVLGALAAVVAGIVALALVVAFIIGVIAGFKSFNRHQRLADARNQVKVTNIQIGTTRQKVAIAQQEAAIRQAQAIGIREAQDEISKTLTPLYVQFEMVDALKQIAASGKNNSIVYIPTGANGIPLISTVGSGAVGLPDAAKSGK